MSRVHRPALRKMARQRRQDPPPLREALGAVLPAAYSGDPHRRGGHPRLPGVRLRAVGRRRRREPLDHFRPVEHHERHRRHLEHHHHLRLVRHLHLEGLFEGHDLAGHDLGLGYRLRSLELRLHLQLHLGPLRLLRPGAASSVHHPDVLHQARHVAAAPGADPGALDHVRDDGTAVRRRARPHLGHAQSTAFFVVSLLVLASRMALAAYQFHRIRKLKPNPLKDQIYAGTKTYRRIVVENE